MSTPRYMVGDEPTQMAIQGTPVVSMYAIGDPFTQGPGAPMPPFPAPGAVPPTQPAPFDIARATQAFIDLTSAYNRMRERAETAERQLAELKRTLRDLGAP